MPPIETDERNQKAVLWEKTGVDEFSEPQFADAVELDVRWETKRMQSKDPFGSTVMFDAFVVVDRQVAVGSLMWLGELSFWYGTGSAGDDDEVMRVQSYWGTPDVKGEEIRQTLGLVRFRDTR